MVLQLIIQSYSERRAAKLNKILSGGSPHQAEDLEEDANTSQQPADESQDEADQ